MIRSSHRRRLNRAIRHLDGLIAYWHLDESSGDAINQAQDTFGTLDGTVTGATQGEDGLIGKAYSFNGAGDFVSITQDALLEGMAELTIMFMLKTGTVGEYRKAIFKSGVYDIGISDSEEIFGELPGVGNPGVWGTNSLGDDIWRIFFMTYDGAAIRMYINEQEVEELGSLSGSVATNAGNLAIGRHEANQNEYFEGSMQHVALFDKVLSPEQILKLAQYAGLA